MSFVERKAPVAGRHPWTLPQLAEIDELMRPITRGPPGDHSRPEVMTMGKVELARRKSNYCEDACFVHGGGNPRRERILGDSMVILTLKTNVIVSPAPNYPGNRSSFLSSSQVEMAANLSIRSVTNSSSSRKSQQSLPSGTNGHCLRSPSTCSTRPVSSSQERLSQPTLSLFQQWHRTSSP